MRMDELKTFPTRLRMLISAKLGRCPRCMRWSVIGSLTGWAVSAIVYFLWPNPILLSLSVLVAVSFTLLMISHIVVFMARVARTLRDHQPGKHDKAVLEMPKGQDVDRRQFMGPVVKAGLSFAVAGFFGSLIFSGRAQAQRRFCLYVVDEVIDGGGCGNIKVGKFVCLPCPLSRPGNPADCPGVTGCATTAPPKSKRKFSKACAISVHRFRGIQCIVGCPHQVLGAKWSCG